MSGTLARTAWGSAHKLRTVSSKNEDMDRNKGVHRGRFVCSNRCVKVRLNTLQRVDLAKYSDDFNGMDARLAPRLTSCRAATTTCAQLLARRKVLRNF
eukprot:3600473-Amphidinium_carterae.1